MKTPIKIGLLVVAVLGIIAAIIFTVKSSGEDPTESFKPSTSFEEKVLNLVKNEIKDKSYSQASAAFDKINSEIQTEKNVVLADGKKKLSDSEIKNCYKLLFDSYSPIFCQKAEEEFAKTTWNDAELSSMNDRANYLASMGLASEGTSTSSSFAAVRRNVAEYNDAKQTIANSGGCSTAAAVESVISKVASFKHAPLNNNNSLMSQLDEAVTRAKQSFENAVVAQANRVANSYKSYNSETAIDAAISGGFSALNSYSNSYGNTQSITNARNALSMTKRRWLDWQVSLYDDYDYNYYYDYDSIY